MPLEVANPANAADVNILGFRALFRPKTALSAAISVGATSVPVDNAKWFKAGDVVYIGDPGTTEEATIDSISGNTITLTAATTGGYASGVGFRLKAFWHLGHVRNPDRTQDKTEREIQSAITGKLTTIKRIVTSISKGMTFESISDSDELVRALHTGNPAYAGVIANTDVFVDDVNSVDGDMILIQENAETGGIALVEYKPTAQISGDGQADGSDGENETALSFTAAFNADPNYTIPLAIAAGGIDAPLGVIVKTAAASLDDVVNVFSDLTA